jgi:phosphatidylserine synthase 2
MSNKNCAEKKILTKPSDEKVVSIMLTPKSGKGVSKFEALLIFVFLVLILMWVASSQNKNRKTLLDGGMSANPDKVDFSQDIRNIFWGLNGVITMVSFFLLPKKNINFRGMSYMYRVMQALAITYAINMLVWALMTPELLTKFLHILDPSLANANYEERDFSIDCRLYTPENPNSNFANLKDTVDIFVTGHLVGWLVKSFIFRNNIMAWTMSILFEIHEISLKHWLPNFNECWWDHLLLDLFGMNLLGLLLGTWIMKKYNIEKFHWFWDPTDDSEKLSYFKRFFYSFTAVGDYVSNHKWHFLARPKSFLAVTWVILLASVTDLNWFFMKNALNLAPGQIFMGLRVWIVGFYSIIVIYDFHKWVKRTGKKRRMSFNMILGHGLLFLESVVFWRNKRPGFFDEVTPYKIKLFWMGVCGLFMFGLYSSYCFGKTKFLKQIN